MRERLSVGDQVIIKGGCDDNSRIHKYCNNCMHESCDGAVGMIGVVKGNVGISITTTITIDKCMMKSGTEWFLLDGEIEKIELYEVNPVDEELFVI